MPLWEMPVSQIGETEPAVPILSAALTVYPIAVI